MATPVTHIIDPDNGTGTDYTSLANWDAAQARNLVSADEIAIAKCRCTGGTADGAYTNSSSWVCDSTRYVQIWTDPSEGYRPDGAGWPTGNKYRIETTAQSGMLLGVSGDTLYIKVDGIWVQNDRNGTYSYGFQVASYAERVVLDSCAAYYTRTRSNARGFYLNNPAYTHIVANCLAWHWSEWAFNRQSASGTDVFLNCTAYDSGIGFNSAGATGTATIRNCVANGNTTDYSSNWDNAEYNLSEDTTAPGTNATISTAVTFNNEAGSDFRLGSGDSSCKDTGTSLASDSDYPFNWDAFGTTRPSGSSWDRGYHELIQVSVTAKITAADATITHGYVTGKITAADATATHSVLTGKITAADATITHGYVTGKITAADATVTHGYVTSKITATDATITHDVWTAKITATDATITHGYVTGKITAADATVTHGYVTGKITAADATVTHDVLTGKITASDVLITYTTVGISAKITASDATITHGYVTGKITAADATITHGYVTGKITAADATVTHDVLGAKITASDATITHGYVTAKVTASDALITYSITSAPIAKIVAVDAYITYVTEGPWFDTRAVRKADDGVSATDFPQGITMQPGGLSMIDSEKRMWVPPAKRDWDGRNPFRQPKSVAPWSPFPLFGLIWYTWDQGNPFDITKLESSYFTKGWNYDSFRQILVRRIEDRSGIVADEIIENGTTVQLKGEAIIDIASMLDVVFFGHWIPGFHGWLIKGRSTAPNGTKILLWSDFESIQQAQFWVSTQNTYWTHITGSPLASTGGYNAYGCTSIDKYEGDPWNSTTIGCPHTPVHGSLTWPASVTSSHGIDTDIYALTGNAVSTSTATRDTLQSYNTSIALDLRVLGSTWYVDGIAFDNLLLNPYKGSSSLSYEATWTTARYRDSWKAFLEGLQYWNSSLTYPFPSVEDALWANTPHEVDVYSASQLKNRYTERFFAYWSGGWYPKTLAMIEADFLEVKNSGVNLVMGVGPGGSDYGNGNSWATSNGGYAGGTWLELAQYAEEIGVTDQLFVPAIQTFSTGSYMMLQDVMRVPT